MSAMKFLIIFTISSIAGPTVASPFVPREKQFAHSSVRIIGGSLARLGEFPSYVQILRGSHFCGGSIVNANWIVTAAHCSTFPANQFQVVAGQTNVLANEWSRQRRTVVEIRIHPSYNPKTIVNDIAVWRMGTPFQFNGYVAPVPLAAQGSTSPPGATAVVAGLGTVSPTGLSQPTNIMRVMVPIVSDAACRSAHSPFPILPGMICAGWDAGRNACRGDSGGPLLSPTGTLVGIVSWGSHVCGVAGKPGVYSSVAYFRSWIDANTR